MKKLQIALEPILDQAIERGIASAISLSIKSENDAFSMHRGMLKNYTPINDESLYDLASLTKIIGTAPAIAHAMAMGKIALDEEPFRCWPKVSVRSLLAHTSGLAAHVKFYEHPSLSTHDFSKNASIIYEELFRQKLEARPFERHLYSDLNFLALGYLLEQRLKKPLFTIFCESIEELYDGHEQDRCFFTYCSSDGKAPFQNSVLTTPGEKNLVHDQNCRALGGIAAHAGLFGSIKNLKIFVSLLARIYRHPRRAMEENLAYFARHFLAFHRASPRGSTRALSPQAFGHFGFTGTSLWVDPRSSQKEPLSIVLLSNRVYLNPKDAQGIFWLRERVHSLAASFVSDS